MRGGCGYGEYLFRRFYPWHRVTTDRPHHAGVGVNSLVDPRFYLHTVHYSQDILSISANITAFLERYAVRALCIRLVA
jgi:hypothetical protein